MTGAPVSELRRLAGETARAAGELLLGMFGAELRIETKSSVSDVVSNADYAAQHLIEERLRAARPDDAFLGEEKLDDTGTTGLKWAIDPLDGTANYVHAIPHWCVSIACEDDEGPLAGAIYDACRDELYSAARGQGATRDDVRLEVPPAVPIGESLVSGNFSGNLGLAARIGHVRLLGSTALDMAWAAGGRCDGFVQGGRFGRWDVAAGIVICREAGLAVLEMPTAQGPRDGLLAAPPPLADAMLAAAGGRPA